MNASTWQRRSRALEWSCVAVALSALLYRFAIYPQWRAASDARGSAPDVIEFVFLLTLFACCCACGASGVALALQARDQDLAAAWRPLLVGVSIFSAYYFLIPSPQG